MWQLCCFGLAAALKTLRSTTAAVLPWRLHFQWAPAELILLIAVMTAFGSHVLLQLL
jgi:hypothetical protein